MTMAGREIVLTAGSRLCDVPLPDQGRRHDDESAEVGEENQHGLLSADRRCARRTECRRRKTLRKSRGVLVDQKVADPLVRAVADAVDEPDCDDFDREDVDQADAERCGRAADDGAEREADCPVHREDQPDGAESLGDIDEGRRRDHVALKRRHDHAASRSDHEQDHGQDAHPRLERDDSTKPCGEAPRALRKGCLHRAPGVFGPGDQRAEDDGYRRSERESRAHDVVDDLVRVKRQQRHGLPGRPRVERLVPADSVEEHSDPRDDAGRDEKCRPITILTPFSFDGCDHDPCFSPVSWKKTSSSDLSYGRSSLTPTPDAMSWRLISMLCPGSVLRWKNPSSRTTASGPNIRVRTSPALSEGCALTTTPLSPSSSCTVDCVTSLPLLITPTRSQICSTSPRRWLDRSTVRPPWAMSVISLRISAMPWGSRPLLGSSRMRRSGSLSSAPATPIRCFMPVEYVPNFRPARDVSSTMSSTSSTRCRLTLAMSATTFRFSRPDRYG